MAGCVSDENGADGSLDTTLATQRCPSGDSLSEWRSCEQVENGMPSTSPPYWDTDDDDDCETKPSELYGKFTWKIENFSQISKRELRSNAFEVGGYKWYILVYPQGCDVCNHLSLFLCVANHEKLLPGWSHFAQFTIAVVNTDPKKSKYSDTLHRFWKKEHDWGWKKFMELSKVYDGFIVNDMLVIKAQVQVIREKVHRLFRCLDCQYRRELVRVYLTNVEGICRRYVEDRRNKLGKLIEDKPRWSSFCAFWLAMDHNVRRRMSMEKSDVLLKLVVRQFFIEKEVTSTLVMDSLYSGLKALEWQSANRTPNSAKQEEIPSPIVHVENDMFVLADDVLELLGRAVAEPLPPLKDDKGPQNRTKEGTSGEEFNKDPIESDERRLTELGRRTVEMFVVTQIYSNRIEVAYQEAVALKRQEELIREEEEAWKAENDLKSKRGTTDKEKRNKKKQAKQKRNNRKKDKVRDCKSGSPIQDKHQRETILEELTLRGLSVKEQAILDKCDGQEEDVSDVSDSGENMVESHHQDAEEVDISPNHWDTDSSEIQPAAEASGSDVIQNPVENGKTNKKNKTVIDDSSSTCSTDSMASVVRNGPCRGHLTPDYGIQISPSRRKKQLAKLNHDENGVVHDTDNQSLNPAPDSSLACHASTTRGDVKQETNSVLNAKVHVQHLDDKDEEVSLQEKVNGKHIIDLERSPEQSSELSKEASSSPACPPTTRNQKLTSGTREASNLTPALPVPVFPATSNSQLRNGVSLLTRSPQSLPSVSQNETQKAIITGKTSTSHHDNTSFRPEASDLPLRPATAPVSASLRPTSQVKSMTQSSPSTVRAATTAGRLGSSTDQQVPTSTSGDVAHRSYRNAIMNNQKARSTLVTPVSNTLSYSRAHPTSYSWSFSTASLAATCSSSSEVLSSPISISRPPLSPSLSAKMTSNSAGPSNCQGFAFGNAASSAIPCAIPCQPHRSELIYEEPSSTSWNGHIIQNGGKNFFHGSYAQNDFNAEPRGSFSRWPAGVMDPPDDFPHLDIINYLLDEEYGNGKTTAGGVLMNPTGDYALSRQATFPIDHNVSLGSEMNTLDTGTYLSSRFERSMSYPDTILQRGVGSRSGSFDVQREQNDSTLPSYMTQPNRPAQRILGPNHGGELRWPVDPSSISFLQTAEFDGSLPQMSVDYASLGYSNGLNGYSMYRPDNRS